MQPTKIAYNDAEFQKRYEELKHYVVTIPDDPAILGFSGFVKLFHTIQEYKNRVSQMWSEASVLRTNAKIHWDSAKYAYQAKFDLLVDTDPEIIALTSDRAKTSKANKKLAQEIREMQDAEMTYKLVNVYFGVIENTFNNLESVNRNLTEQANIFKKSNPPPQLGGAARQIPGPSSSISLPTEVP